MAFMQNRVRFGALFLSLALLAGACGGGGGDDDKKVASDKTTTTESSSDSTLDVGGSTTTGVSGASGGTTTTKKGGTATTAKPGGGSVTTAAPSADPNAVPGPAKTGTYGYSQSGTTPDGPVPPNGTLVVSGGQTQTFSRSFDPGKGAFVLIYDFRDNGPYITAASIAAKGATIKCTFSPVPVPPWPPTPGKTFSGSGTCTSLIGPMSATINGSITSRNGDIVGINSTVHVKRDAPNPVDVTLKDVEQWSISLRVPKTSHQTYSGSALGQPITGDVSSTLTSTP